MTIKLVKKDIPKEMLLKADEDTYLKGYVFPDEPRERIAIEVNGSIVGFMTPRKSGDTWRTGAIYIDPEHRGKGFATSAIVSFFSNKKSGIALVEPHNEASQRAFSKAGFGEEKTKNIKGTEYIVMNKYLEKAALNAQKARSMAKEVGVIADHESQWKWALRNLRDGKGNALQGKDLALAKQKMGYLPNNTYQKIKSLARKQPSLTEVGGTVDGSGNIVHMQPGPARGATVPGSAFSYGGSATFHTHPVGGKNIAKQGLPYMKGGDRAEAENVIGEKFPHRMAGPSGREYYLQDNREALQRYVSGGKNDPEVTQHFSNKKLYDHLSEKNQQNFSRQNQIENLAFGKYQFGEKAKKISDWLSSRRIVSRNRMKRLKDINEQTDYRLRMEQKIPKRPDMDMGMFGVKDWNRKNHSIIAPDSGTQSVTRVSRDNNGIDTKVRTVYFDRNPNTPPVDDKLRDLAVKSNVPPNAGHARYIHERDRAKMNNLQRMGG